MRRLLCPKRPSDACKFLPSPCFDVASVKIKDPNVYSVQTGPQNQKTPPRPGTGISVYVPIPECRSESSRNRVHLAPDSPRYAILARSRPLASVLRAWQPLKSRHVAFGVNDRRMSALRNEVRNRRLTSTMSKQRPFHAGCGTWVSLMVSTHCRANSRESDCGPVCGLLPRVWHCSRRLLPHAAKGPRRPTSGPWAL